MERDTEVGLGPIEQIAMPVEDVDRAEVFYRDLLGMKHLFRAGDLVFFDCGGVRLMLSAPEGQDTPRMGSIVYFRVPDIHRAHETLTARGVSFVDRPHRIADMSSYELWMAFFKDSEGNLLAITAHREPGAP